MSPPAAQRTLRCLCELGLCEGLPSAEPSNDRGARSWAALAPLLMSGLDSPRHHARQRVGGGGAGHGGAPHASAKAKRACHLSPGECVVIITPPAPCPNPLTRTRAYYRERRYWAGRCVGVDLRCEVRLTIQRSDDGIALAAVLLHSGRFTQWRQRTLTRPISGVSSNRRVQGFKAITA